MMVMRKKLSEICVLRLDPRDDDHFHHNHDHDFNHGHNQDYEH